MPDTIKNKTMEIMEEVYNKISEKYGDKGDNYVDWMFFRAISQVGGYDDDESQGIIDVMNIWKQGAGNAYEEECHQDFFVKELGLSEQEYNYLKYNIRMQHSVSSSPEVFNTTCVSNLDDEKKGTWKDNMEKGMGLDKISDKQMQNTINDFYNRYNGKGDFSHMCYTLSGNLNNEWEGVDNRWLKWKTEGWENAETRKDVIGWLGDATITVSGDDGPSFGLDDYISDLDADNVSNRIDYENGVTAKEAMNDYYNEMTNAIGNNDFRGEEFLKNNSYEDIEKEILDKLDYNSYDELAENENYSETIDFLDKLKKINK